jgi:mannonate dehydratase
MIRRRQFFSATLAAPAAAKALVSGEAAGTAQPQTIRRPVRMKLGCQSGPQTDERLEFFARYGVQAICGTPEPPQNGRMWSGDELGKFRENVEKHGMSLDMVAAPFLESTHIDRTKRPAIMLGRSPDRDRDIEDIQTLIRNCRSAGIPAFKYNLNLLGVPRTTSTPGRGGTRLSTWRLSEAGDRASRTTIAGRVSEDAYWERITYFLQRVVPVAAEYRIRMACHPHDPGVPPGFEGVDCVLGTVEGLKKFVAIEENPYHGLNFCQGTVSEMLQNPTGEIAGVIRHFGGRKKIFNVHFRNIRGRRDSFQETFPDEGDVNMLSALLAYRDSEYEYMLMPDHVPRHDSDPGSLQSFAFCYGYIRALLQAVSEMG